MQLLTQAITKKLPPIGSTDGKPANERKIICKFFSIASQQRWYVLEGDRRDNGDYELYTYTTGTGDDEYGYSMLWDMQEARWRNIPAIERDRHFGDHTLQEVLNGTTY
jgi:hypothetical protein